MKKIRHRRKLKTKKQQKLQIKAITVVATAMVEEKVAVTATMENT
jgi:hypothetical protein